MKIPYRYFTNKVDFDSYSAIAAAEHRARCAFEAALADGRADFTFEAFCSVCAKIAPMKVDLLWGNGRIPNWRERLECPCGLNNRIRAAWHFLVNEFGAHKESNVYITEQITPLHLQLLKCFPHVTGSEYLRDGTPRGSTNPAGVRHEDLTSLTFDDRTFDYVLTFDVLEHVPNYRQAVSEIARVLKPSGHMLATFPFDLGSAATLIRASLDANGDIRHHLPPEYHGDPTNSEGCLCFQIFGWDLLGILRDAGFSSAGLITYWQPTLGFLGGEQIIVVAVK